MEDFLDKLITGRITAKRVSCKANTLIFSEKDVCDGMFLIESGKVKILKRIPDTNKDIDLATFGPNEFFGEMSLIEGRPRSADAIAVTDSALWLLDEKGFHNAIAESPEFSFMILKGLTKRLTGMNEKMQGLVTQLKDFSDRFEDLSTLWQTLVH